MKQIQHDALLEQAIYTRAARTLCRDGWSCEQINGVLKNTEITQQQYAAFQDESKSLDELQEVFGPPANSLYARKTAKSDQSELDFLNRGPDAATEVLRENDWEAYEISLVIQDSMFVPLEEPKFMPQVSNYRGSGGTALAPVANIPHHNGYALSDPLNDPYRRTPQTRQSRRTLKRDTLILAFMAAVALALLFTLL